MPHPDYKKKKLSDDEILRSMKKGEEPELPPALGTRTVTADSDDAPSMFKRVERPEDERADEPELPNAFTVSESSREAEVETQPPEQTRDQIELLQQIVALLENLPNEIGDSVADALGVNS